MTTTYAVLIPTCTDKGGNVWEIGYAPWDGKAFPTATEAAAHGGTATRYPFHLAVLTGGRVELVAEEDGTPLIDDRGVLDELGVDLGFTQGTPTSGGPATGREPFWRQLVRASARNTPAFRGRRRTEPTGAATP